MHNCSSHRDIGGTAAYVEGADTEIERRRVMHVTARAALGTGVSYARAAGGGELTKPPLLPLSIILAEDRLATCECRMQLS